MSSKELSTINSDALAMLPKAPEVVQMSRNIKWLALAGLVVAGAVVAPVVTFSLLNLAKMFGAGVAALVSLGVLIVTAYGVPHYVRLGKLWIDMKAEELTWEYIERDPVAPLVLWLNDIESEGEEYGDQLGKIEEVIEQITRKKSEVEEKAQKAEERAHEVDPVDNEVEFSALANEHKVYLDLAERLNSRIKDGQQMLHGLGELYNVFKNKARSLKIDIDAQRTDWEVSKLYDAGMDSAEKLLIKGSERKEFAEKAAKIITDRYAGEFGRLRSVRKLSGDLVTAYRADQSAAAKQLLAKWQKEKQGLLPVLPAQNVSSTIVDISAYSKVFNNQN
jgi:hypothetical protein